MRSVVLALLAPLLGCASAAAPRPVGATVSRGALQLIDWRATNSVGTAGATLFGTVRSSATDTLIELSADVAERATLHITSAAGTMQPAGPFAVGTDAPLVLRDRGAHVMMEALSRALVPGDSLTVQLRFSQAGIVALRVPVFRLTEASAELP